MPKKKITVKNTEMDMKYVKKILHKTNIGQCNFLRELSVAAPYVHEIRTNYQTTAEDNRKSKC